MAAATVSNKLNLEATYQRDLNRILDADRNTRKRGLQKLLESLPWEKKSDRAELLCYVNDHLLRTTLTAVADPVEKCRELALRILKNITGIWKDVDYEVLLDMNSKLCERIAESPFPETAEELRLLVVEILVEVTKKDNKMRKKLETPQNSLADRIVTVMCKALNDNFPAVKRTSGELITYLCKVNKQVVRTHVKLLVKGLSANSNHQHSKTRQISLQALGKCLTCLGVANYRSTLQESVLQLFQRSLSDRTGIVRVELAQVVGDIIEHRIKTSTKAYTALIDMDFELLVILILLYGDDIEEVSKAGYQHLCRGLEKWEREKLPLVNEMDMSEDIDNAELVMQQAQSEGDSNSMQVDINVTTTADKENDENEEGKMDDSEKTPVDYTVLLKHFFSVYLQETFEIILNGMDNWTTELKVRYSRGLEKLATLVQDALEGVLLPACLALSTQIRDEEHEVRVSVESTCATIGQVVQISVLLEILLPRVLGEVSGSDTAQHRTGMIRVLTHVWKGLTSKFGHTEDLAIDSYVTHAETISQTLIHNSVLNYRDVMLREALLLSLRAMMEQSANIVKKSAVVQRNIALALVYLNSKCPHEQDTVPEVARKELIRLAGVCTSNNSIFTVDKKTQDVAIIKFLSPYFISLYAQILFPSSVNSSEMDQKLLSQRILRDSYLPPWDNIKESEQFSAAAPSRVAFETLIRECPFQAWANWEIVIPIIKHFTQPRKGPEEGSAEANMQQYAAVSGDESSTPNLGEIDIRLSFMALLEGMIRDASSNWECSAFISQASQLLIKEIVVPNLIWRVGRVEATIRKVALAVCYGILKAGAVQTETLFNIAMEIVPLLVGHLDDSEVTPRLMACLGLAVIFERLRGVFSDQAIREMYPKIIARLDDSSDDVRVAICTTLDKFLLCGVSKNCYTGTLIDYILDQLFIHLDDPNPNIQQAVFNTIVTASNVDKGLVIKKAESNRLSHRSPVLCDKVIIEVQGFEILS